MDLNPSNEIKFISDDIRAKSEKLALPPLPTGKSINSGGTLDFLLKEDAGKIKLQDYSNVRFGDVYAQIGDGNYIKKYDTYLTNGGDQEEYQAQKQSSGDQTTNGLLKAGATALSGVVSGTVGAVYGAMDMVRTGNFSSVYDNDFTKVLDNWNEKLRYELPNYYTKDERDNSILENLSGGKANFWANDFAGGLGFTIGAIGSELIWDVATGGGALATTGARLGNRLSKYLNKAEDITTALNTTKNFAKQPIISAASKGFRNVEVPTELATGLGKTGKFLNTARFTYTSAGTEAGMEARHYMREMEDDFYNSFEEKNGRLPSYEEDQEFRDNLQKSANALYAFNLGVVGASNLATIGRIFNISSPTIAPTKWINAKLFGSGVKKSATGELTALVATKGQKVAQNAWGLARSPIIEGLWEEGLQSVGKNTAKNWVEAGYNPALTKETYGLGQATIDGFADTYGTKEGWNEVGIGMLVGLLTGSGVNLATGRGLTGEFKAANMEAKNLENFSKYYSPKKVSESILYANRAQQSAQNEEEAVAKGDFTSAKMARKSGVISQLNFAHNLDYFDETVEDTLIAIDNIDNESIAKEYGVSQEEAPALKEAMKEEYKNTAKEYKKYRDFSEYFVGDSLKKEGLKDYEVSNVKQAIAYEFTLGSEAYKFSSEILESLKSKIASGYTDLDITTAMDVDNILLTASKEVQEEWDIAKNNILEVKQKKQALEKEKDRLLKVILDESQEQKVSRLGQLNNVEVELQEVEFEAQRLEKEANATLAAAQLNNPFNTNPSKQFLTLEQIENLDDNLNKVKDLATNFRNADPQKALEIQKLREEYGRSLAAFKRYADLARQISDPTLGLRGKRNIISEIRSEKSPNEITVETLEGLRDTREQLQVENTERILTSQEEVGNKIEELSQEADSMEVIDEVSEETLPEKKKSILELLNDILNKNPYLLSFKGTGLPSKPTVEEVSEYFDLATRALGNENFDPETFDLSGQLELFSSSKNLTEEEINRLKELNQKMSDWQLYGGALNEEGIPLTELIEQQIVLNQDVIPTAEVDVTEDELGELTEVEPKEVDGDKPRYEDIAQTYSRVFVRAIKGAHTFHNISISKLLSGINSSDRIVVTVDGVTTDIDKSQAQDFSKEGAKYTVLLADGQEIEFSIIGGGVIKTESFDKIRNNSAYKTDRYILGKQSGYSLLYDGDSQVESDFKRIDGSLSYQENELYELATDEPVGFQINLEDPWNKKVIQEYKDSNKKDKLQTLEASLKIYIVDETGNILGDLKANREIAGISPEFLKLRAKATQQAIAKDAPTVINMKYQAPIRHMFLGVPNFTFDEQGNYNSFDIPQDKIVDFGYIEGGALVLKNGSKGVRKDFVSKILKKDGIPVIVFKVGKYNIAFPVKLNKTSKQLGKEAVDIVNNSSNLVKASTEINKLLIANGLKPVLFYSDATNQNIFDENGNTSEVFNQVVKDLNLVEDFSRPQTWKTTEDVALGAKINVDLNDLPIVSPKPIIAFESLLEEPSDVYERYQAGEPLTEEEIVEFASKAVEDQLQMASIRQEIATEVQEVLDDVKLAQERIEQAREGKAKLNFVEGFEQIDEYSFRSTKGTVWIVPNTNENFKDEDEKTVQFVVLRDEKLFNSWKRAENKRKNDAVKNPTKKAEIDRAFKEKITGFLFDNSDEYLQEIPKAKYSKKDALVATNFETSIANNEQTIKDSENKIKELKDRFENISSTLSERDLIITEDKAVKRKTKELLDIIKEEEAKNNLNKPC